MASLFLLIGSCNEMNKENAAKLEPVKTRSTIIKKPESSFNDTLIIKTKAAVFYTSDSLQMEKVKKVNEKVIYDMLTHNCHYQMQNAREVIKKDWPQIRIIEAFRYRYLLFINSIPNHRCRPDYD